MTVDLHLTDEAHARIRDALAGSEYLPWQAELAAAELADGREITGVMSWPDPASGGQDV